MADTLEKLKKLEIAQKDIRNKLEDLEQRVDSYGNTLVKKV